MNNKKQNPNIVERIATSIKNIFNEVDFLKNFLVPIHPSGYPFIIIFFVTALILGSFSDFLGWLLIILTLWCIYFFRDPKRIIPNKLNSVVAPADGKILPITQSIPPKESGIKVKMQKISIFMNVFDVHVNRIPISGKIKNLKYVPGLFFNASLDKASKDNERMIINIELENGIEIVMVQIAGLVARRIKCDLDENQKVVTGEKFGIIRFGSRLDLYLPLNLELNVLDGQTSIGGETVICSLKEVVSSIQMKKKNKDVIK